MASADVTLDPPPLDDSAPALAHARRRLWWPVAAGVVLVALVLRTIPRSALWLDEAQSVSFASLPFAEIPGALREDGAPPLYYLILHVWMSAFGDGDVAVRSLSAIFSIAALVVLTGFVHQVAGRRAAMMSMVMMACSPFAVRYGSETRMYSLVMLEVAVGLVVLWAAIRRPDAVRLVGVGAVAAALLYTHYWSLFLLTSVGLWMVTVAVLRRSAPSGRTALRIVLALLGGAAMWLPWLPTFLFQSRRTATPWAGDTNLASLVDALGFRFSGAGALVPAFAVVLAFCVLVAIVPRRASSGRSQVSAPSLASVMVSTAMLALVSAAISDSAFTSRYLAVAFPLAIVLIGIGLARLPLAIGLPVLAVIVVFGSVLSWREINNDRTQAESIVDAMDARPGDVVVYCPDQLGPAMHRVLDQQQVPVAEISFLPASLPERVDWIDYTDRYRAAEPRPFVRQVESMADDGTVWFVVSLTYPPTQRACSGLLQALQNARPDHRRIIDDDPRVADHGALWRFDER